MSNILISITELSKHKCTYKIYYSVGTGPIVFLSTMESPEEQVL